MESDENKCTPAICGNIKDIVTTKENEISPCVFKFIPKKTPKYKRVRFFADMDVEFGGKPEPTLIAIYEENEPGFSSLETIEQRHIRILREKDERHTNKRKKRDEMTEQQDIENAIAELEFIPTFIGNLRTD